MHTYHHTQVYILHVYKSSPRVYSIGLCALLSSHGYLLESSSRDCWILADSCCCICTYYVYNNGTRSTCSDLFGIVRVARCLTLRRLRARLALLAFLRPRDQVGLLQAVCEAQTGASYVSLQSAAPPTCRRARHRSVWRGGVCRR